MSSVILQKNLHSGNGHIIEDFKKGFYITISKNSFFDFFVIQTLQLFIILFLFESSSYVKSIF